MLHNLFNHLYIVGTASAVVIAFLVAFIIYRTNRTEKSSRSSLSVILIVLSLSVATNSGLNVFLSENYPSIHNFPEPFQLLFGPLIFIYLSRLNQFRFGLWTKILHLLPFALFALFFMILLLNRSTIEPFKRQYLFYIQVFSLGAYFQLWVYYFLSRGQLKSYRANLKKSCSTIDKINEAWVEYSLFGLLLCYSAFTVLYLLNHGLLYLPINKSLAIIISIIIFLIVYRTISQPGIISGIQNNESSGVEIVVIKYQKSSLNQGDIKQQLSVLKQYMQQHRPYLESSLNLQLLADDMKISSHHLSQIINDGEKTNFYDFINGYRINEFKKQLSHLQNTDTNLINLAFDSGFNSKATFNRLFKKTTGQTPTQYRKQLVFLNKDKLI